MSRPSLVGAATVTGNGLRLRSAPGLFQPVLGLLYPGDRVWVRTEFDRRDVRQDWLGVWVMTSSAGLDWGLRGYVHRDYVAN
ncbi:SH3 domain-containing protein [Streptomyces mayteni]